MPDLLDMLEGIEEKEGSEPEQPIEANIPIPTTPEREKITSIKNTEESKNPQISDYKPHGTDIMTSYKLITGKSIRKYKGKGTSIALLEGLIQECMKLKEKWLVTKNL